MSVKDPALALKSENSEVATYTMSSVLQCPDPHYFGVLVGKGKIRVMSFLGWLKSAAVGAVVPRPSFPAAMVGTTYSVHHRSTQSVEYTMLSKARLGSSFSFNAETACKRLKKTSAKLLASVGGC